MSSLVNTIPSLIMLAAVAVVAWWLDKNLSSELKIAMKKTVKCVFFWGFVTFGAVLAARSFTSFGSGAGAIYIGSAFFIYGLSLFIKKLWARTAQLKEPGIVIYGVLLIVVSSAGQGGFIRDHEANFEPLFAALEEYRATRGSYPEELVDLIPDYLVALPECPMQFKSSDRYYSRGEGTYHLECMIGVSGLFPYRGWYNPNHTEWFYYD